MGGKKKDFGLVWLVGWFDDGSVSARMLKEGGGGWGGRYRCGIRGRRGGLWGGSSGASAGRLALVAAGLGCPLILVVAGWVKE